MKNPLIKTFAVRVEFGARTRLLFVDEGVMRQHMEVMLTSFFKVWTDGPQPAVQVTEALNAIVDRVTKVP